MSLILRISARASGLSCLQSQTSASSRVLSPLTAKVPWSAHQKRFVSHAKRRKKGIRQMKRSAQPESNLKAINAKINSNGVGAKEQNSGPSAFYFLGVFPLVATGCVIAIRDDLREEFKQKIGWE
jgi:hypothetical protein